MYWHSFDQLKTKYFLNFALLQASDKGPYPLYSTQVLDIIITNVEVLPSNDVGNLKMASPPALFFVIISVTSSLLVLIIIILIAVVKCRTDRKVNIARQ